MKKKKEFYGKSVAEIVLEAQDIENKKWKYVGDPEIDKQIDIFNLRHHGSDKERFASMEVNHGRR